MCDALQLTGSSHCGRRVLSSTFRCACRSSHQLTSTKRKRNFIIHSLVHKLYDLEFCGGNSNSSTVSCINLVPTLPSMTFFSAVQNPITAVSDFSVSLLYRPSVFLRLGDIPSESHMITTSTSMPLLIHVGLGTITENHAPISTSVGRQAIPQAMHHSYPTLRNTLQTALAQRGCETWSADPSTLVLTNEKLLVRRSREVGAMVRCGLDMA